MSSTAEKDSPWLKPREISLVSEPEPTYPKISLYSRASLRVEIYCIEKTSKLRQSSAMSSAVRTLGATGKSAAVNTQRSAGFGAPVKFAKKRAPLQNTGGRPATLTVRQSGTRLLTNTQSLQSADSIVCRATEDLCIE